MALTSRARRWSRLALPALSTAGFYALYYLVARAQFAVSIEPAAVPFDYLLQLAVAYLLFAWSRRLWVFVLLQGLLMAVLYVGNAAKMAFFGGPILPDDLYALRSLLLILEGWHFFAVAAPLAAMGALLLFNFTLRRWSGYVATAVALLFVLVLRYQPQAILEPLDRHFGHSVWDQRSNYLQRGATLYSLQEGARYFAHTDGAPDRDLVRHTLEQRLDGSHPVAETAFLPRNVHILLLESFWDPGRLRKAGYDADPMAPEFRDLWQQSGHSQALSPVFGGYTANAEFEILCGFPVTQDAVKFERQLSNEVPCLPRLLAQRGYRTLASHPNVPAFWNRLNVYRRIGFQTYWSKKDFARDDMNREFLADASLYRQVLEKIEPFLGQGPPVFNYILTYFGHWNYPLSASRPPRVASTSPVPEVGDYANTLYWQSRELWAFLEILRARDPEALILVLGDHLPFLGNHFAGYVDSGVLAARRSDFDAEQFRFSFSTPMVLIDGRQGPLRTGMRPMYEIPALLLQRLRFPDPSLFDYTRPPPGLRVRPLPGLNLLLDEAGGVELCRDPPFSGTCQVAADWLRQVRILDQDLFIGEQFARARFDQ